jgi:hypothetical protein
MYFRSSRNLFVKRILFLIGFRNFCVQQFKKFWHYFSDLLIVRIVLWSGALHYLEAKSLAWEWPKDACVKTQRKENLL